MGDEHRCFFKNKWCLPLTADGIYLQLTFHELVVYNSTDLLSYTSAVRSPVWVSVGQNQGVSRAALPVGVSKAESAQKIFQILEPGLFALWTLTLS